MKKGFTLIEALVAVSIFVSLMIFASLAFMSAIKAQRHNLAYQELLDQTSYVMEYMSRHLRMAKQAEDADCYSLDVGDTYKNPGNNSIEFYDQYNSCTKFFLEDNRLKKESGGDEFFITSPNLEVYQFEVAVNDDHQPRVSINLGIRGRAETSIEIQTTVSQRDLKGI